MSTQNGVVAFTGHMMDRPGRIPKRFPAGKRDKNSKETLEEEVRRAIRDTLEKLDAKVAFGSAACGGDILFMEEMLERTGEIHIVLPYEVEQFKQDCLRGFQHNKGQDWEPRFNRVWQSTKSGNKVILSSHRASDNSMASECCNRTFLGMGLMKAKSVGGKLTLLALWDGWSGDAPGGTRSMVKLARSRGVRIVYLKNLHPKTVKDIIRTAAPKHGSMPPKENVRKALPQEICAVLFADAFRFSKITEPQIPLFVAEYLEPLGKLIQEARQQPIGPRDFNTWGDGLYCTFDTIRSAGRFALKMQRFVKSKNWPKLGLPEHFNLRIALHVGPVYRFPDPFTPNDSFLGSAINFAARIEPKTIPGEIFCSQAFVALATAEGVTEFEFDDVGRHKLPKLPGKYQLYVLRSKRPR